MKVMALARPGGPLHSSRIESAPGRALEEVVFGESECSGNVFDACLPPRFTPELLNAVRKLHDTRLVAAGMH